MRIIKTRFHNQMEDVFFCTDNLIVYIEKTLDSDSIFNDFILLKERHTRF